MERDGVVEGKENGLSKNFLVSLYACYVSSEIRSAHRMLFYCHALRKAGNLDRIAERRNCPRKKASSFDVTQIDNVGFGLRKELSIRLTVIWQGVKR